MQGIFEIELKSYKDKSLVHVIIADGIEVHLSFSLIAFCVLYLLSSYLFWTELEVDLRHWLTLFIMTIHTCSVQNGATTKQTCSFLSLLMNSDGLISLFDDQRSSTNIQEFLLNLQTLFLFFSHGDATLFSAVVCIILFTQPFCLGKK